MSTRAAPSVGEGEGVLKKKGTECQQQRLQYKQDIRKRYKKMGEGRIMCTRDVNLEHESHGGKIRVSTVKRKTRPKKRVSETYEYIERSFTMVSESNKNVFEGASANEDSNNIYKKHVQNGSQRYIIEFVIKTTTG